MERRRSIDLWVISSSLGVFRRTLIRRVCLLLLGLTRATHQPENPTETRGARTICLTQTSESGEETQRQHGGNGIKKTEGQEERTRRRPGEDQEERARRRGPRGEDQEERTRRSPGEDQEERARRRGPRGEDQEERTRRRPGEDQEERARRRPGEDQEERAKR
uniref:Uncharacterized protein n=1 Tax=Knipowitschia caucasica TaxID=637954 RepID=A0AAV2JSM2_KNICA